MIADSECLKIIHEVLTKLELGKFVIKVTCFADKMVTATIEFLLLYMVSTHLKILKNLKNLKKSGKTYASQKKMIF